MKTARRRHAPGFPRLLRWVGLTLVFLIPPGPARAATPDFADQFANRILHTRDSDRLEGTNAGASVEPGEPRHGGRPGGASVWIAWKAPADGIATFSTDGSAIDTLLSAYYFAHPADTTLDKLKEIARNDDAPGQEPTSLVQFGAHAGVTYQIAIDGYRGATGSLRLRWDFVTATSPPPVVVSVPDDQAVREGDPVTLTVVMPASPDLDLQWRFNGNSFGATGTNLVFNSFQAANVGRYTLRIRIGDVRFETIPTELQINSEGQTNVLARDKLLDSVDSGSVPDDDEPGGGLRLRVARKGGATGVSRGYAGTQVFNTTFATVDPTEPPHCGLNGGATYWFSYQPPADGTLVIDTLGSTFDTFLAGYTYVAPLTTYAGLVPVACDDNGAGGNAARVEMATMRNRTYLVVVGGVNGVRGIVHLNYHLDTNRPPVLPFVPPAEPVRVAAVSSPLTLQARAQGSAPLRLLWHRGTNILASQTNDSLVFPRLQPADEGDYWVEARNHLGASTGRTTRVRVVTPTQLAVRWQGSNTLLTFPAPSNQSYTVEFAEQPGPTNWRPVGATVRGNGQFLSLPGTPFATRSGFYRVRVE